MLWFGFVEIKLINPAVLFKNILCYGSAAGSLPFFGGHWTFKNILCYGSAKHL